MRKITTGLFHSLDGVVEAPNLWQFDSFDDEVGATMGAMISATDTVLMGRVGYQEWAGYWPNAEQDDLFGSFINPVRKHVASRTLTGDLAWQNATLVEGELVDFVRELKQTEGGDVSVCASISIVRELVFAGLLDELTLVTHPVVAGRGRHLFHEGDPTTRLTLVRGQLTSKGNTILTYGLRTD
jgi:dihydrofolate reductase